jgi:hypothetical protein
MNPTLLDRLPPRKAFDSCEDFAARIDAILLPRLQHDEGKLHDA